MQGNKDKGKNKPQQTFCKPLFTENIDRWLLKLLGIKTLHILHAACMSLL